MKGLLYYLMLMVFVCGCDQKAKPLPHRNPESKKGKGFSELLEKFDEIRFDTLKVVSEVDFKGFEGHQLDSMDVVLFPKEVIETVSFDSPQMFACYKFYLDSFRIGLIARTPSEYDSSSIKLFIYDVGKDKISNYIELGENWGDAGDALEKTSWIFKNAQNKTQCLVWVYESEDHSAQDINDTIVEIWNRHYLIDLSKQDPDTINDNSEVLSEEFKKLLN